jgi:uncharacterized protein YecA (UPF0149 family)
MKFSQFIQLFGLLLTTGEKDNFPIDLSSTKHKTVTSVSFIETAQKNLKKTCMFVQEQNYRQRKVNKKNTSPTS